MPFTGYEKRYTNPVRTERGTGTPPTPRPCHQSLRPYVCGMCLSAHMQPCVASRLCQASRRLRRSCRSRWKQRSFLHLGRNRSPRCLAARSRSATRQRCHKRSQCRQQRTDVCQWPSRPCRWSRMCRPAARRVVGLWCSRGASFDRVEHAAMRMLGARACYDSETVFCPVGG